jgi:tight adherence protein B
VSAPHLFLLGSAGSLAVAGTSTLVYFVLVADESPFRRVLGRYEERLERHTTFLLMSQSGSQIARLQLILCSVLVGLFMISKSGAFALLCAVTALFPPVILSKRHMVRISKLERQLDTWLLMLANSLKATSSVAEAIASTVPLVPRPFLEEVDLLVKEMRLGAPLHRAVTAMARRINSTVISGALATIVVASQTGGNLPQTLEQSSAALRESARLDGVLRTKTAEGRGQVLVLASMPFLLCTVIGWLDPSWFDPLLDHRYGRAILAACAGLWILASLWAYRIVRVDL